LIKPFLATPANERASTFSPDSRWIAYVSDESGRDEVYLTEYPGPGVRQTVSRDGGIEPVWAHTGRELFYRIGNTMMSVAVTSTSTPTLVLGQPVSLFENSTFLRDSTSAVGGEPYYDVGADGRFLMVAGPSLSDTRLIIVENWIEVLGSR
jgi:Tol biopolymer transport system component